VSLKTGSPLDPNLEGVTMSKAKSEKTTERKHTNTIANFRLTLSRDFRSATGKLSGHRSVGRMYMDLPLTLLYCTRCDKTMWLFQDDDKENLSQNKAVREILNKHYKNTAGGIATTENNLTSTGWICDQCQQSEE
jgi:hypothetical protein